MKTPNKKIFRSKNQKFITISTEDCILQCETYEELKTAILRLAGSRPENLEVYDDESPLSNW